MNLPEGTLLRSRVVDDFGTVLEDALDRRLTGYATVEAGDELLFDGEGRGVLAFEEGVPVAAYHTGTDRSGSAAVGDLTVPGPCRVELYELDRARLDAVRGPEVAVSPETPAERLAGDPALAERTRAAAPDDIHAGGGGPSGPPETEEDDALESFLADEERIEAIREEARREARQRAREWGFEEVIDDEASDEEDQATRSQ